MQGNDHLQQQYGSINPSTICMGPKATRSGTSGTQKVISIEHTPIQTQQTRNISSTNEGVTMEGLKQPRHKLPLKMILSEVARRGDYSHAAVIPTRSDQSKSAYSSVDAILANPALMDNKRNRHELLAHPNYLGKKRSKNNPYDVLYPLRKLIEVNSNSKSVQEKQCATTTGYRSIYDNEEDPFIPSKEIPSNRANRPTLNRNYYLSGTTQAEVRNFQNLETYPKNLHEDKKCANNYNNLSDTPFAKARFENLYGNNFGGDIGGPKLKKSNLAHIQEVGRPIYEMQTWCKEKTFPENDPYANSRAPPDNERLAKTPAENTKKFKKSTTGTGNDKCTQNSFLSTQCFFLPKVFGESERDSNDEFVWNPQVVQRKSENENSRLGTRQSILKTSRSCLKSKVHFSSQPREENIGNCLQSNYHYQLSEYSVTIDSQTNQE